MWHRSKGGQPCTDNQHQLHQDRAEFDLWLANHLLVHNKKLDNNSIVYFPWWREVEIFSVCSETMDKTEKILPKSLKLLCRGKCGPSRVESSRVGAKHYRPRQCQFPISRPCLTASLIQAQPLLVFVSYNSCELWTNTGQWCQYWRHRCF